MFVSASTSQQLHVARFVSQASSGSSVVESSGRLLDSFRTVSGHARSVTDFYAPNLEPALKAHAAGETVGSAADASLVLGLASYWNVLSGLPGASGDPIRFVELDALLRSLGLGSESATLAASALFRGPGEEELHIISGRKPTPAWFRRSLKKSDLWNRGMKASVAAVLARHVILLEKDWEKGSLGVHPTAKLFEDFAASVRGRPGLIPLESPLKKFLTSDHFVARALEGHPRRRAHLIAFLSFSQRDQSHVSGLSDARFPDFESFQRPPGRPITEFHNNFYLHFVDTEGTDRINPYRFMKPYFLKFKTEFPGLERTLTEGVTHVLGDVDRGLMPFERLLYEAYRIMAGYPEAEERSLSV